MCVLVDLSNIYCLAQDILWIAQDNLGLAQPAYKTPIDFGFIIAVLVNKNILPALNTGTNLFSSENPLNYKSNLDLLHQMLKNKYNNGYNINLSYFNLKGILLTDELDLFSSTIN
jgi:hypothetical protein